MKYLLYILLFSLSIIQLKSSKASNIVQYALERVGSGYIWGGRGQILTEERLKELKNKYPSFIDEKDRKWIGKQVFDCSGLVKTAFEGVGIHISHGATSAWENTRWAIKGEISNLPKDKISILYRESYKGMVHTAIYIGNGQVIDAKGNKEGVVKEDFNLSWTHFGIPFGLY